MTSRRSLSPREGGRRRGVEAYPIRHQHVPCPAQCLFARWATAPSAANIGVYRAGQIL